MKKTIAALILALPLSAFAAAATWSVADSTATCWGYAGPWSTPSSTPFWQKTAENCRSVKAVCASGTCDAPTLATQGMSLDSVGGFSVTVCADSGQTLSGAGTLKAYLYDGALPVPAPAPDLDLTVTASGVRCQSFAGFTVTAPRGRVYHVPVGVTVSSGGTTVTTLASSPSGAAL